MQDASQETPFEGLQKKLRSLSPLPGVSLWQWQAFVNEAIEVITRTDFRHWPIDEQDRPEDPRHDQSHLQVRALFSLLEAQHVLRERSFAPLTGDAQREFARWRKSNEDIWVACVWAQITLSGILGDRVPQDPRKTKSHMQVYANGVFLLDNVLTDKAAARVKAALKR